MMDVGEHYKAVSSSKWKTCSASLHGNHLSRVSNLYSLCCMPSSLINMLPCSYLDNRAISQTKGKQQQVSGGLEETLWWKKSWFEVYIQSCKFIKLTTAVRHEWTEFQMNVAFY